MLKRFIEFIRGKSWLPAGLDPDTIAKMGGVLNDVDALSLIFEELLPGVMSQERPVMVVVAGSPGSGKTSYRKRHFSQGTGFALRDIDEVMMRIPGYRTDMANHGGPVAFGNWWRVAMHLAEAVFQFALKMRYNIIYDRTCGSDIALLALQDAKKTHRYQIELNGFYVPLETAKMRVAQRFLREQKVSVTEDIIREHWEGFSALWPRFLDFVDSAQLFDNSIGELDPRKDPLLVCRYSMELGLVVTAGDSYEAFLTPGRGVPFEQRFPALSTASQRDHSFWAVVHQGREAADSSGAAPSTVDGSSPGQ